MIKVPIVWWIVIILTGYIVFLKSCEHKCPAQVTAVKRDTVKLAEVTHVPVYIPAPESVTPPDTEYLVMWIDTAAIVKDYLSKYAYRDTIRNKYGYVLVLDTITQNKVANRDVTFHMEIPQITLTQTVAPKNQLYVGLGLGGATNFISFGPQVLLKTKTDRLYWLGASYTTQNQYFFQVGSAWKIHF